MRAVTVCLLAFLVGCSGTPSTPTSGNIKPTLADKTDGKPTDKTDAPPPDWTKIGKEFRTGDVVITMLEAFPADAVGADEAGRPYLKPVLIVKIRVANQSKTKVFHWGGWDRKGTVEDEHGNEFKPGLSAGFVFAAGCSFNRREERTDNPDKDLTGFLGDSSRDIKPGETSVNIIYVKEPPDVSKEIRLTLPASSFDPKSKDVVRFRLPIQRPKK